MSRPVITVLVTDAHETSSFLITINLTHFVIFRSYLGDSDRCRCQQKHNNQWRKDFRRIGMIITEDANGATAESRHFKEMELMKLMLKESKQEHILKYLDSTNQEQRYMLETQLAAFNVVRVVKEYQQAVDESTHAMRKLDPQLLLPNDVIVSSESVEEYVKKGLKAISKGELAVVTLAGGQGTRLGSIAPKGCYDIGLPSRRSLFELQALKIRKLGLLASGSEAKSPLWMIMTSSATDAATRQFFELNNFFGVLQDKIKFFVQGELPAIEPASGRLIMSSPSSLAMSPNGNGGIFEALNSTGIIDQLQKNGVKYLHVFSVDNCLVKVGDPAFIGACISRGSDCAAKSIRRTDPKEPVGVFCRRGVDKKLVVAEYSELSAELAAAKHGEELALNQGNIANHFFTVDFAKKCAEKTLPYHLATKKIPTFKEETMEKAIIAGHKMETFIFDVMERAERPLVYQSRREDEFAPLKNAEGPDSPVTSRKMMMALNKRWLRDAGADVDDEAEVEISPLISYSGEGLEAFKGRHFGSGQHSFD